MTATIAGANACNSEDARPVVIGYFVKNVESRFGKHTDAFPRWRHAKTRADRILIRHQFRDCFGSTRIPLHDPQSLRRGIQSTRIAGKAPLPRGRSLRLDVQAHVRSLKSPENCKLHSSLFLFSA